MACSVSVSPLALTPVPSLDALQLIQSVQNSVTALQRAHALGKLADSGHEGLFFPWYFQRLLCNTESFSVPFAPRPSSVPQKAEDGKLRGLQSSGDRLEGVPGAFNFFRILAKNNFKMKTDILQNNI